MMEKLINYKTDQLPGGRYWEPSGEVREILASLKPHNDSSESVLGMNDWLTTAFPSMHQQTRSTLIEMSTNKTVEWLAKQPSDRRNLITSFAASKKKKSQKQRHQAQQALEEAYLRQREAAVAKAKVKESKKAKEKELLQEEVMIQSVEVLEQTLREIQNLSLLERVKSSEIQKLVKKQLQIRSKVLQQKDSRISFTTKGRPRPITELIQKLKALISSDSSSTTPTQTHYTFTLNFNDQPSILSKVRIRHKLKEDGKEQWFDGQVQSFAIGSKEYKICYDGFDSLYSFSLADIVEDYENGDLEIL